MRTDTATIRVPEGTRDDLAWVASYRGSSLSGYLTQLGRRERRAVILEAARREAAEVAANPAAAAEYELWQETADGID